MSLPRRTSQFEMSEKAALCTDDIPKNTSKPSAKLARSHDDRNTSLTTDMHVAATNLDDGLTTPSILNGEPSTAKHKRDTKR